MDKEKPTTLPDLPLELLLVISDHLSPVDIACLALCNRRLLLSLGSACDDLPKNRTGGPEDGPRVDLLTRFSRGLPQYYLCDACLRLHPWHKVALPGPKFKVRACVDSLDHSVYRLKTAYLHCPLPEPRILQVPFCPSSTCHAKVLLRSSIWNPRSVLDLYRGENQSYHK